jgi:hypothetical protein
LFPYPDRVAPARSFLQETLQGHLPFVPLLERAVGRREVYCRIQCYKSPSSPNAFPNHQTMCSKEGKRLEGRLLHVYRSCCWIPIQRMYASFLRRSHDGWQRRSLSEQNRM